MPPKRTALFIGAASAPVTGGEVYDAELITGLRRDRTVEVVTPDDIPTAARGYLASNRWLFGVYRRRFRRLVIVADHFWHPRTFLFLWAGRVGGARVVIVIHHVYHRLRPRAWQRWVDVVLEAIELAAAHHVIVNSESTADDARALGVRRSGATVIRPAVSRVPDPRRGGARADGPLRLLAVGYVGERKGLEFLIEAMGRAACRLELTVVGAADYDPGYRAVLDRLIDRHGLGERVVFAGRVGDEELRSAYERADVFVAPALWEGFGMAILEAMLYGLPVVATRIGAIPELVSDGVNGLLVPTRDSAALATALDRLAGDAGERLAMGERGRARGVALATGWASVQDRVRAIVATFDAAPDPAV